MKGNKIGLILTALAAASAPATVLAADHAESLQVISSLGGDIADVYAFMDPNDASKAILAFDVRGFIVPGENSNISPFDDTVLYRLEIENTGDARADKRIDIIFDKQTSRSVPQIAHITIDGPRIGDRIRFDAPTTVGSATAAVAPTATVTTDPRSGVSFFAGLREDPFFFDIPSFNRFTASATAGKADPSLLTRGRDTFAGYNVQMIALSVPASLLRGSAGSTIGVSGSTFGSTFTKLFRSASVDAGNRALAFSSPFLAPIDRMGLPVINTVVIPFPRKDEFNSSSPRDDAAGRFTNDIVATLKSLGTNTENINLLASLAITRGDILRLNTALPNTGRQGGQNAAAAFPNGRRPTDDVIDTVIRIVTNGGVATGDNVNNNDAVFLDSFPFFAPPNQPRVTGVIDDNTRN
jgi:hypothetical protein